MRIFTVKQGTDYTPIDVDRVYTGARAWINQEPTSFHCITENTQGLNPRVNPIALPQRPELQGWWAKLFQFSLVSDEPTLYFDLDLQIRDTYWPETWNNTCLSMPLDYLAHYRPERNIDYVNSSIEVTKSFFGASIEIGLLT